MNNSIPWKTLTIIPDVMHIPVPNTSLRRWEEYVQTPTGIAFQVRTAGDEMVPVRIDIVAPDVIRVRMNSQGIRQRASEMLMQENWTAPAFSVNECEQSVELHTERLRLVVQKMPWQVRVYDRKAEEGSLPFFAERINDRAFGYAYEVPPVGYQMQDDILTVHETVAMCTDEALFGFGEKFTPLNKRGQELFSWAFDAGNVSSQRSYKNIPFFMSTAGYGVFVHSSFPILYRLGSKSSLSYSFHISDSQLDYFLIYGPGFPHILRRYTELTGRAPVPPKWSFGFWISRCGYKSRQEVEEVVREMRERGFPCDVISLDPWWMGEGPWCTYEWDEGAFPQPAEMIRSLRESGVRTCLWVTPYVPAGTPLYEEGTAKGYFLRRPDGRVAPVTEAFAGESLAAIDFTNPEAENWFQSHLRRLLEMGVAVFKTDFGEQAPLEAVSHDGRAGLEIHNLYPLLYNRSAFELTREYFGRGLVWGRSAYAGSQRYPVQWGGDSYSSLDQMRTQLLGLLSYGMAGVPFCSHDVGGFDYPPEAFDTEDQTTYPRDAITYIRWLQFGVFSSHVRAHGKQPREPWMYGEKVEGIAHFYLDLRYRLLPYIYSEAVRSSQTGLPMVRPLVLADQDDRMTWHIDHEYLFGESFLVAPVASLNGRMSVYLPRGLWVDYWNHEMLEGGRWMEVRAPLERLPLWVRAGSIIPMGPAMSYVDEKPLDPLTVEIYAPGLSGQYVVYDEERAPISIRYTREGAILRVEVDPAPSRLEVCVYGPVIGAAWDGDVRLRVEEISGGRHICAEDGAHKEIFLELVG